MFFINFLFSWFFITLSTSLDKKIENKIAKKILKIINLTIIFYIYSKIIILLKINGGI